MFRGYIFNAFSENGTELMDFLTGGKITSTAISDDGKYIVIGSDNDWVYFLAREDSSHPRWKYKADDDVRTVGISSDGNRVVIGDAKGKITYWSQALSRSGTNPPANWTYTTTNKDVLSVSMSDDGARIAAGGEDGKVYFLDGSGSNVWNPKSVGGDIYSVAVSNDGEYLVAGGKTKFVYFFDESSNDPLWTYNTDHEVKVVAISYFGTYVAAGSDSDDVYFFDASRGSLLWSYDGHGKVNTMTMSYDGRYLLGAGDNGWVYYFYTRSGSPIWSWKTKEHLNTVSMTFDGNIIVGGGDHKQVYYWFGAKAFLGSKDEDDEKEAGGAAWSVDLGGKVTAVAVNPIYGPNVTIKQDGLDSLVVSSDTRVVYVDSSNNMYTGILAAIISPSQKKIWPMDVRSWFPNTESGNIPTGTTINLMFTIPTDGYREVPAGTYNVYVVIKGIASDGIPFIQRLDCGTTTI